MDEVLQNIINAEKECETRIEEAQKKIETRLAQVRKEEEQKVNRRKASISEQCRTDAEAKIREAEAGYEEELRVRKGRYERLLNNHTLKRKAHDIIINLLLQ